MNLLDFQKEIARLERDVFSRDSAITQLSDENAALKRNAEILQRQISAANLEVNRLRLSQVRINEFFSAWETLASTTRKGV